MSTPFSFLSFLFPHTTECLASVTLTRKDVAPGAQFSVSLVPMSKHNWIEKQTSIHNMSGHGANGTVTAIKLNDSQNSQSPVS